MLKRIIWFFRDRKARKFLRNRKPSVLKQEEYWGINLGSEMVAAN